MQAKLNTKKMMVYHDFNKKFHVILRKFLLLFQRLLKYLVRVPSFESINISSLSRKKYEADIFTPTPRKRLRDQNNSVGIGLIELTEPSDTLSYKPFFKQCILKTILHAFSLFIFVWDKTFCFKNWAAFYIFWFGLGWHSVIHY